MTRVATAHEAEHGQKMIEVKVRFFTNNLVKGKGQIRPKHGWTRGVVRLKRNDAHGIKPGAPIPFNSLMELGGTIEKLLIREGITLHTVSKMEKYVANLRRTNN